MNEHPLLYNAQVVQAILDGRQTQDRRPIKPQPYLGTGELGERRWFWDRKKYNRVNWGDLEGFKKVMLQYAPWQHEDRLWVRETWLEFDTDHRPPRFPYRADITDSEQEEIRAAYGYKWRPSIHMPKWASRITLEVLRVWVERVQEISKKDAIAEGIYWSEAFPEMYTWRGHHRGYGSAEQAFGGFWDSIYAKRGYGFDSNPWVWACEFRRIE